MDLVAYDQTVFEQIRAVKRGHCKITRISHIFLSKQEGRITEKTFRMKGTLSVEVEEFFFKIMGSFFGVVESNSTHSNGLQGLILG